MAAFVRDIDRGYKGLLRSVLRATPAITVGVHGDEGGAGTESGATVADVASVHRFGLGNHPQRSFIRAWFDAEKGNNRKALRLFALSVIRKLNTPRAAAEKAALFLENSAKKYIQSGSVTPATDKEGGTTLIDTGQLVTSIRGKVEVA